MTLFRFLFIGTYAKDSTVLRTVDFIPHSPSSDTNNRTSGDASDNSRSEVVEIKTSLCFNHLDFVKNDQSQVWNFRDRDSSNGNDAVRYG
jgi:hypothetical protein